MGTLFDKVRAAASAERVLVTDHADERLRERGIPVWQVVVGVQEARLILERPDAMPRPAVEVEEVLADGTPVKAVWAYSAPYDLAVLVTVHLFDR